jgi:hypothetical protein
MNGECVPHALLVAATMMIGQAAGAVKAYLVCILCPPAGPDSAPDKPDTRFGQPAPENQPLMCMAWTLRIQFTILLLWFHQYFATAAVYRSVCMAQFRVAIKS